MGLKKLGRPLRSVFTKLLLVMGSMGLLLYMGIGGVYWHVIGESRLQVYQENAVKYTDYLIRELGSPPSHERAKSITQETGLGIRFIENGPGWTTSELVPLPESLHSWRWRENNGVQFARRYNKMIVVRDTPEGKFLFSAFPDETMMMGWLVTLLVVVALVLFGAFVTIRWILRPLRDLARGVRAISAGDLTYRVPEYRTDELGRLTRAFNHMSGRIQTMLAARERLLLDVSHELRSPLTRIKVALEFLPPDDTRSLLRNDVEEMERMITEILENARLHSRFGRLDKSAFDLRELLEELLPEYDSRAPGVRLAHFPNEVPLFADPEQVSTVMRNLITNALKYTPADSAPVEISVEMQPLQTVIHVRDFGQGIAKDELELIFEPFYRTDRSRNKNTGGYGLGLSLCKAIMEAHDGSIAVNSVVNAGTIFTLNFPQHPEDKLEKNLPAPAA